MQTEALPQTPVALSSASGVLYCPRPSRRVDQADGAAFARRRKPLRKTKVYAIICSFGLCFVHFLPLSRSLRIAFFCPRSSRSSNGRTAMRLFRFPWRWCFGVRCSLLLDHSPTDGARGL